MDLVEMGGRLWTQMNRSIPCQAKDVLVEQNSKEPQDLIRVRAIFDPRRRPFGPKSQGNAHIYKVFKRIRSPEGVLLEQNIKESFVLYGFQADLESRIRPFGIRYQGMQCFIKV